MGIGPLLAGLPIGFHVPAEYLTGFDLLACPRGLVGGQVPGLRLSSLRPREAVVRTVPRLRVVLAAAL